MTALVERHGNTVPGPHAARAPRFTAMVVVASPFVAQRLRPLPSRQNRQELLAVTGLIEDGKLTPVIGRTYPLADTADGLRYVEQGHARGKVVITVA